MGGTVVDLNDPLVFMHRAVRPDSLCCETVGLWLEQRGVVQPYSRRRQAALWVRLGAFRAAVAAAERIGLKRIHGGCARTGDVVLFQQAGGITVGLCFNGLALAAAGGKVVIHKAPFLAAWKAPSL